MRKISNWWLTTDYWFWWVLKFACMMLFLNRQQTHYPNWNVPNAQKHLLFISLAPLRHTHWYVYNILANNFEIATIYCSRRTPINSPHVENWLEIVLCVLCVYVPILIPSDYYLYFGTVHFQRFQSFDKYLIWGGKEPSPLSLVL